MFDNNKGPVEVDENGNPIPRADKRPQKSVQVDFGKFGKLFSVPLLLIVLAVFVFATATYTVGEAETALVVRFGSVQTIVVPTNGDVIRQQLDANKYEDVKVVVGKGLFFKVPFVDEVEKYSSQLLTYTTEPSEVTTSDKKKVVLDNNAQWRIKNAVLFRAKMQSSVVKANTRIEDLLFSRLRESIGLSTATQLISDKDFVYAMTDRIKAQINIELGNYGVEVYDVRIAKTEFPTQNYENIYNRMRTERQKVANLLRAEGDEQYQVIVAKAEREATIIKAQAYATAEKIKGEGDATALEIYAQAYNKDPEFYQFYRTLITYKEVLGDKSKIVIDSDSEFAKYLFKIQP